jgi:hypothetical protein
VRDGTCRPGSTVDGSSSFFLFYIGRVIVLEQRALGLSSLASQLRAERWVVKKLRLIVNKNNFFVYFI